MLKGSSSYIGASNVHYMSYFIQENFEYKNIDKMWAYYPGLIEACIQFRTYSRTIIAKRESKFQHLKFKLLLFCRTTIRN